MTSEAYPQGVKRGQGNFAVCAILENIVQAVYIDRE